MAFTDFPNGLINANDYLSDNISANAQLTTSVANISNLVVSAEIDFNLKEIICSLLAGRGLLLPNIQICISLNLKELLGSIIGTVQDALYQALSELDQAFDRFMDHLKMDEVLGRINNVIAEITNIANMINFCSAPIDPIRIPNVLEGAMDSFLGAGRGIVDAIGQIIPDQIGGCLIDGSFNGSIYQDGLFKKIWDNIDDLDSIGDSIIADITSIVNDIDDLIDRERSVPTNYALGGSDLIEEPRETNFNIGPLYNAQDEGIQGATSTAYKIKGIYDAVGDYPVTDSDGNVYNNILELFCDGDLLRVLSRETDPKPKIAEQVPVTNYCGEIIGYTQVVAQEPTSDVSTGTVPDDIDQPGFNAGGLPTNPVNAGIAEGDAEGGGTVNNTITNTYNIDGATLFVADSTGLLNSGAVEGQLVYRQDNGVTYLRNNQTTNTIEGDYEVVGSGTSGSGSLNAFLTNVNDGVGNGILVRSGDDEFYRSIFGSANEITIADGNGTGGNPTVGIADNPVLPGTDSVVLPFGTTGQRVSTTNGALRYNTTTGTFEGYQSGVWAAFATGAGSVVNGTNLGAGSFEVFKQNNAGVLEFRTIEQAGAISISVGSDLITIDDDITASSLGIGNNVFKQRSGNDFEFRSLLAGGNVTLTQTADSIEISSSGGSGTSFAGTTNTTNGTLAEVLFDGSRQTPASDTLWFFVLTAVANRSGTDDATAIKLEGLVDNNSGTVTIVGTSGNKTTYNSTLSTANYDLQVDIVSNQFRVRVQGDTGHTVDWRVKYEYIESP